MIGRFWQDLRFGARSLGRNPGFVLTVVVTLALGIGANTAIFSVVNSVLLSELPFRNPDQLMWLTSRRPDRLDAPFTLPDFLDYRDQNRSLEEISAFAPIGLNLSGMESTERVTGARVSANLFHLLGVTPSAGRTLVTEDDHPGRNQVVMLTYDCWQRRFGGDLRIVGTTLKLNDETYQVVGVLPSRFELPIREAELAIPLSPDADPLRNVRTSTNFLRAIGRLRSGITIQEAEADLTAVVMRERQLFGSTYAKKIGVRLIPLRDEMVGSIRPALWLLLGAVALVLLIACSNLTSLALARTYSRSREIAIRRALGATTARLTSQMLTESLMLTCLGGAAGVLLAVWGTRLLLALSPTRLPRQAEVIIQWRVLAFAAVLSVAIGLVLGIFPALKAMRADRGGELKIGGRGGGEGARQNCSRNVLVIAEVSLSFVLLISAVLLIQSFERVRAVEPGFDPTNVLTARLSLPKAAYKNRAAVALLCDRLSSTVRSLPGVQEVGGISDLPLSNDRHSVSFWIEGRSFSPADAYTAQFRVATPDYFQSMKIPLLRGRGIDQSDKAETMPVALINDNLARKLWPNASPLGARINIDDNNTGPRLVEIVGIVGDVKHLTLESAPTFDVYLPWAQLHEDWVDTITNNSYWVVRSSGDGHSVEQAFLRELRKIDPEIATAKVRTMEEYLRDSLGPRRFSIRLLTIFSIAALVLAATGIYGVVSYSVSERTQEIGIRTALGASRTRIVGLVLKQGMMLVLLGLGTGTAGALGATQVIRGLLFGTSTVDASTFALVAGLLIMATLLACSIPAWRATKVDPLVALRDS